MLRQLVGKHRSVWEAGLSKATSIQTRGNWKGDSDYDRRTTDNKTSNERKQTLELVLADCYAKIYRPQRCILDKNIWTIKIQTWGVSSVVSTDKNVYSTRFENI